MNNNLEDSKKSLLVNGYCVLRDFIPSDLLDDLKVAIKGQCLYIAKNNNIEISPSYNLDEMYNLICSYDRALGSVIFDNIRNLPEFLSLVSCASIRSAASNFLNSNVLFSPPNFNTFRIDKSGEDEHLLTWHQDYTYEFLSNPSLTFWVPIFEVPEKLGPPIIISDSHSGLKETEFTMQKNIHGADKVIPVISQEALNLSDSEVVSDTYSPGDVLVMNTFVVHKSGKNKSTSRNRWTAQIRIGTFEDENLASRNWAYETSGKFDFFKKYYPDLTRHANT